MVPNRMLQPFQGRGVLLLLEHFSIAHGPGKPIICFCSTFFNANRNKSPAPGQFYAINKVDLLDK